ncbi:hypothetical protein PB1_00310 [Bacillus methanolicus PB1]|uniref:Uncharacterized protein n=1 Tax=Bacillus methanolicus PB1 TaxID=997296 RepID=I3E4C0_BACMT|nr:hypothetical protein [Bacillus methanolicus]EIJ81341.1 hypothetical protein PB1_00310 [Bacillus methanolicus PB1]
MKHEDMYELSLYSIRSVFYFESALIRFLNSLTILLKHLKKTDCDENVLDTVYHVLEQTNELQKQMNKKIILFSDRFTKTEVYSVYQTHEEYDFLSQESFPDVVKQLHKLSKRFSSGNYKKDLIDDEVNQSFLLYKKRKRLLKQFKK